MNTFRNRFEDYYVALGNAEQVTIYNRFAGSRGLSLVYDSDMIDEVFNGYSLSAFALKVARGKYNPLDPWFTLDEDNNLVSIEIVPEWLEKHIPAMANYYEVRKDALTLIDAGAETLYTNMEDARKILRTMSLEECIDKWNDRADHYNRFMEIHPMSELEWWDRLSRELGAWYLLHAVLQSGGQFIDSDMWFFYDQDRATMLSFSTKQELLELIGVDFFIDTLISE